MRLLFEVPAFSAVRIDAHKVAHQKGAQLSAEEWIGQISFLQAEKNRKLKRHMKIMALISPFFKMVCNWLEKRKAESTRSRLNDHYLRDIGIERTDIPEFVNTREPPDPKRW